MEAENKKETTKRKYKMIIHVLKGFKTSLRHKPQRRYEEYTSFSVFRNNCFPWETMKEHNNTWKKKVEYVRCCIKSKALAQALPLLGNDSKEWWFMLSHKNPTTQQFGKCSLIQ